MPLAGDCEVQWSSDNRTRINTKKTKEMVIDFKRDKEDVPPLILNDNPIERVHTFCLLGLHIADNLSWEHNTNKLTAKSAPRLYYLKQLSRSGMSSDDLLVFYKAIVRPVLEYACPAWHPGLTKAQSDQLETLQKRALQIVFPSLSYREALTTCGLSTLSDRREDICKKLFYQINNCDHKLNYLLPCKKMCNIT